MKKRTYGYEKSGFFLTVKLLWKDWKVEKLELANTTPIKHEWEIEKLWQKNDQMQINL